MAKGDYSIRYDPDKLRGMIEEGKTAKEIMKAFKISPYTLREHLAMLQDHDQKIYFIKGLFEPQEGKPPAVKKEGLIFSKELIKKTGFSPGDAFEMIVEADRIILKKIETD
jgi:hypothetical protein